LNDDGYIFESKAQNNASQSIFSITLEREPTKRGKSMNSEDKLISLYLTICNEYQNIIYPHVERFTNAKNISFTDEKVMAIYCYEILMGYRTISVIHQYAQYDLRDYPPKLCGEAAFVHRLNSLSNGFIALISFLQEKKYRQMMAVFTLLMRFLLRLLKITTLTLLKQHQSCK